MVLNTRNTELPAEVIIPLIKENIARGQSCRLKVTGNSMFPTLKHKRDSVILTSPKERPIKKGEIVLIKRRTGNYILHRVYRILDKEHFIMNGDNQEWIEVVNFNQVIAVANKIVRKDKEISCNNLIYKFLILLWMSQRTRRKKIYALYAKVRRKNNTNRKED